MSGSLRQKLAFGNVSAVIALLAGGMAITAPGAAVAQTTPEQGEETGSGEIVVTATRHAQSVQRVPIAVTALTGEALVETRTLSVADLAAAVPGPTFVPVSGASGSQMMIRGQYASDDSPAFDTPVGIFIDDVYYGSVASFYPDFFDVEQIAVLRGPQGTTFGRNTVGGAIQVTSRAPDTSNPYGQITGTVRNHNGIESTGFLNLPFSSTFAGRFAYSLKEVDGDIHNVTTGNDVNNTDIWSVRGSTLWRPSNAFDLFSSMTYTKNNSLGDGPVLIGQGALIASLDNDVDSGETYLDDDGATQQDIFSGVIRGQWHMPWATFASITSYRTLDSFYREDIDGSPVPIAPNKIDINEEEQFTQEFRLTSVPGGSVDWVVGLYYLNQSVLRTETYTFGGLAPWRINTLTGGVANRVRIGGDIETESYAPFGELTWRLNDQWALTGGVRYTHDSKDNVTDQVNLSGGASTIFFGAPKHVEASESWDAWTPRAIVTFQPNDDLMFYASASRGYKSGGFNYAAATVAQAQTPILPESSWSYEIGAKTYWFDRALRLNIAAYDAITEDLQVRSLVGTVLQVNNAGEAEIRGVEIEAVLNPTDALTLGLNYAYTDAEYSSYEGCATYANPAPPPATLPWDCSGNRIPFVPENSFNIFAQYEWSLANDSSLRFRLEDSWADAYEVHIGNGDRNPTLDAAGVALPGFGPLLPRDMTEKDHTINAFLTYEAPGGQWSIQAWGRNLTDERHVTFATNYFFYLLTNAEATAAAPNTLTEADRASVSQGQSFGVTATWNFN